MQKISGLKKTPESISITYDQLEFILKEMGLKGFKSKSDYIRYLIEKEREIQNGKKAI